MPAGREQASSSPEQSLQQELEAARRLLEAQGEVERALLAGGAAALLEPLLARQRAALATAEDAARERAHWFSGPGSLQAWLDRERPPEAAKIRRLAEEAASIKTEIGRRTRRGAYLAKRALEWTEAQVALLVDSVTQDATGVATYGTPDLPKPGGGDPRLLDRRA